LRKHADYQRVYQATRKQFSSSMSWFLAARSQPGGDATSDPVRKSLAIVPDCPRVGLTAGKVLGKAHERNRIKRRMREVVRHCLHELPNGVDLILHPKRSVMTMDFGKLEAEVLRIFRQAAAQIRAAESRKAANSPDPQSVARIDPTRSKP
jgi:ribonuclease P protein component